MRGGDLIWVPLGWVHRVLTTRKCMGIGAFYVHPAMAVESVESFLNCATYGSVDAYVGHANMVALKEQDDTSYEAPKQNLIDLRVPDKEYHYLQILTNIFLPNIGDRKMFAKYRDNVEEATRRMHVWQKDQSRGAYLYPEKGRDIHQDYLVEDHSNSYLDHV